MSRKKMVTRQYTVRFNTPAFLGNAEQNGQWRTPPFKAALRQWWRVAWAAEHDFNLDVGRMRADEAVLFGSAADGEGRQSLVRLRLNEWQNGDENKIKSNSSYLAFGKADINGKIEVNESKKFALKADSHSALSLAFPEHHDLLDTALLLLNHFGTVGGRSRNGWGSLALKSKENSSASLHLDLFARDWQEALKAEWAHALGKDDDGLLLWRTGDCFEWEQAMTQLSAVRKEINQLAKEKGKRKWITRPCNNDSERLPNSLRFKVRRDEHNKFYGVIFHMPCKPPADFKPDKDTLISLWQDVHGFLDQQNNLRRIDV